MLIKTTQIISATVQHEDVVAPEPQPNRIKIVVPILNLPKIDCPQDIEKFLNAVDSMRDTWCEYESREGVL